MNREDLKKYRYNQIWIKEQMELYQENKARAEGLKSMILDGMPKAQNHTSYAIEELMDKFNYILDILKKDQEKQNQIMLQLREVEEPYRTILTKRYIQDQSLVKIADEMNYNYERIRHMNGVALNKFDKLDKDDTKKHSIAQSNVL